MFDTGCLILDAGCLILDAGCLILDAGCWMFDTGCWMLDLGVSPSAFAASCLRVKKSDSSTSTRTRTSLFLTVTLHQDTRGGAEALRPCRSRSPRPSSNVKDFCRQKAQKAQKIVNSRSSIVKADISRPNSALTEDGLNLGKGPASQCRPFLNISLD
jgi:hypothetical protein